MLNIRLIINFEIFGISFLTSNINFNSSFLQNLSFKFNLEQCNLLVKKLIIIIIIIPKEPLKNNNLYTFPFDIVKKNAPITLSKEKKNSSKC